jgi:hypothetical protein
MTNPNSVPHMNAAEALQARFAHRIAAHLSVGAESVGADIAERLRFARERALESGRAARTATAVVAAESVVSTGGPSAALIGGGTGWWVKLASVLPLVVLAGGLLLIQRMHNDAQIAAAAQIDAELLADDLPPAAYSDDGFAEFLKNPRE